MAFATGMRGGAARQFLHIGQGATLSNLISLLAGVTAILSLLMIAAAATGAGNTPGWASH